MPGVKFPAFILPEPEPALINEKEQQQAIRFEFLLWGLTLDITSELLQRCGVSRIHSYDSSFARIANESDLFFFFFKQRY